MSKIAIAISLMAAAVAVGCGGGDDDVEASASGTFAGVNGQTVEGTAEFSLSGDTVTLVVDITSATDGDHGMHIHEVPACGNEGSDAGAHWDPVDNDPSLHGLPPDGHLGDLGNVTISGGVGTITASNAGWTLSGDADTDVAPHAIIFHEMVDDGTMPSAGARHGCAVITVDR